MTKYENTNPRKSFEQIGHERRDSVRKRFGGTTMLTAVGSNLRINFPFLTEEQAVAILDAARSVGVQGLGVETGKTLRQRVVESCEYLDHNCDVRELTSEELGRTLWCLVADEEGRAMAGEDLGAHPMLPKMRPMSQGEHDMVFAGVNEFEDGHAPHVADIEVDRVAGTIVVGEDDDGAHRIDVVGSEGDLAYYVVADDGAHTNETILRTANELACGKWSERDLLDRGFSRVQ